MLFNEEQNTPTKQVEMAIKRLNQTFAYYVDAYKQEFDCFWRNKDFTPEQMAAAWGTNAVALFARSAQTKAYLLSIDPNCLSDEYLNPLMTVTANQDGTVTLS